MSLLRIRAGSLAFGHVALLDGVELAVEPRERLCLIGRNGTGKSTLLSVLCDEQSLDTGELWRRDGLTFAKLAQEVPQSDQATLFEVVAAGLGDHSQLLSDYHVASNRLADADEAELAAFGRLQSAIEEAGAWEGSQKIDATLTRLNLDGAARLSECSGGVRRRAMLGQAMVSEPDLLLLDEPTNHLDIETIDALEEAITGFPGSVLFITHDRTFIDNLATRIIELDRGQLNSYPGSYQSYLKRKTAELAAEAEQAKKFDKNLAQEEVWIRQGIKARRTRNEGRVRRLEGLRRERAARRERQGQVNLQLESGERSGKLVLEAEQVSFGYPGEPDVIHNFSTTIMRGDRVGIIGRNGSGKSTLLKLLLGDLTPSQGSVQQGTQLKIAYFDQERAQLDPEISVWESLDSGSDQIEINGKSRHVISYLGDFLFPPARVRSPVKSLSGGERNRLLLAKLFTKPANLLVLDEPTNDLDVETLELLEELLSDYQGTLLLVSHDRSFLDRSVTSTLAVGDDGRVGEYVGGYSDWLRQRPVVNPTKPAAPGAANPQPKTPSKGTPPKGTPPKQPPKTRQLNNKERRELEALPEKIEQLETRQATLAEQTQDPKFYESAESDVAAVMRELAAIDTELTAAYARWESLDD